jgi:hypothetical protein
MISIRRRSLSSLLLILLSGCSATIARPGWTCANGVCEPLSRSWMGFSKGMFSGPAAQHYCALVRDGKLKKKMLALNPVNGCRIPATWGLPLVIIAYPRTDLLNKQCLISEDRLQLKFGPKGASTELQRLVSISILCQGDWL